MSMNLDLFDYSAIGRLLDKGWTDEALKEIDVILNKIAMESMDFMGDMTKFINPLIDMYGRPDMDFQIETVSVKDPRPRSMFYLSINYIPTSG